MIRDAWPHLASSAGEDAGPRERRLGWVRAALMGGAALLALCAEPALAKGSKAPRAPAPPAAVDDGLGPRDVYIEADQMIDDRQTQTVTATGHVESRYQGRTLRADRLDYDTVAGTAHAHGHVAILNADGTSQYGEDIQLDDQFRTGVALGFSARLQDNVKIIAGAAIKRTDDIQELRSATYTPCDICKADGVTPIQPTWSVRASRITQDHEHQVIYYRNAVILVKGVPVLYLPVFWHPDPTSPRRSGLLTPKIEYSKRRGVSYQQGYLQTLGPSAQLIIDPQINTAVNPLLNLRFTERFYSGTLDIRAGYTHEQIFDNHVKYDDDTNRSYILAHGRFNLDNDWDWGFGAERVTDPTFFRRYNVENVFSNRGLFPADTDRLISQIFSTREDGQSYLSIAALSFQSIRQNGTTVAIENGLPTTRATFETSKAFPVVAPVIEARWDPNFDLFGGRLRARGSAVLLSRDNPVYSAYDPLGVVSSGPQRLNGPLASVVPANGAAISYTDSRRASGELEWRRDIAMTGGVRVEGYAQVRGDVYSIADGQAITAPGAASQAVDGSTTRLLGTLGTTISWPLIRQIGNSSLILEPIAQFAVSPKVDNKLSIPNEDSVAFEFDETNLFSFNRLPGFDVVEGGARANIGGRANWLWGAGHSATFTAGRVFRTEPDLTFTSQSGLRADASDYVVAATVTPLTPLTVFSRARLDADDFKVHRQEVGVDLRYAWGHGGVRYDYNENGLFVDSAGVIRVGKTEDVNVNVEVFPLKNWGFSVNASRDLQLKVTPTAQFGLIYRNDCIRVDVLYTHDETYAAAIGASDAVTVRLTLATFGDTSQIGRKRSDAR